MEFSAPFSRWLKQRRTQLDFTQGDLARRINYSPETIRKIEAGALKPSRQIADRLAEPLAVPDAQREAFIDFATGAGSGGHSNTLPTPATSLVGREMDVAAVHKLLRRRGMRLVTLLGPPGVGKTRLAIEAAQKATRDFADGVCFVALGPISVPELVAVAVAQALGLPIASTAQANLGNIKEHLRERNLLLALDNFEQVLAASAVVSEILAAAPEVKAIVTSRAALRISGEHEFVVESLKAPVASTLKEDNLWSKSALKEVSRYSAVNLFVQRARAIKPNFALTQENAAYVAEICRRLDGLPLAIELAAARIKLFTPEALLGRMSHRLDVLTDGAHDLPQRQRTLRDTIDWSYRLLTADEQAFWRRLSIFVGGFTLDAATHVAGVGLSTPATDLLQSLVDKSLLQQPEMQQDTPRFSFLVTLHEYALDKLRQSGEENEVRSHHAEYFAAFAESVVPDMNYYEQAGWSAQLDRERENLSAAVQHARASQDAMRVMRLIAAFGPWLKRLPDPQGWTWVHAMLAQPEARQPSLVRAKALLAACRRFTKGDDDWSVMARPLEESAALFRELGEMDWYATSLVRLGILADWRGEYVRAQGYCEQGASLFVKLGKPLLAADAFNNLAWALDGQGKHAQAAAAYQKSLAAFEQLGDTYGMGNVFMGMGELAFNRGDYAAAASFCDKAADLLRDLPVFRYISLTLKGWIAYVQNDVVQAETLLEKCVGECRIYPTECLLARPLQHLGFVQHLLGKDDAATASLREAITVVRARMDRSDIALCLDRFAWIAVDRHQPCRAAQLLGSAQALREWMGAPLPLGDKPLYDTYLARTCTELDEAAFDAAWAEGHAMTLDEAVALAME
jgi:predicted ATPase/DNA-binding XRE family transcriptional regulator